MLPHLVSQVVGAIAHMKHVTTDQVNQVKRLQISLKDVKATAKAAEKVKASIEKALAEANARAVAVDGKLDIFFIEKDMIDRSLTLEKIDRANAEFALPKRRNERNVSRAGLLQ